MHIRIPVERILACSLEKHDCIFLGYFVELCTTFISITLRKNQSQTREWMGRGLAHEILYP